MEHQLTRKDKAHLEVSERNTFDFLFQVFNSNNLTFLSVDNELIGSWTHEDIHYFQGKFSMKIIESIYQKGSRKGVFFQD